MTITPDYDAVIANANTLDPLLLSAVQGNLLRGYNIAFVRHIVVQVGDAAAARAFLGSCIDDNLDFPQITNASEWQQKPQTCLNVGISAHGLTALGVGPETLRTFPEEFRIGAAGRATKVGDVDNSAPEHWRDGFNDVDRVHLMWTVHAQSLPSLDEHCAQLEALWATSGAFTVTSRLNGAQLPDKVTGEPGPDVHFGYRDGIAQPRFQVAGLFAGRQDRQPLVPIGALLQVKGETSFQDVKWQVPALVKSSGSPDDDLSHGSCFNAFRVLEQDVAAFENFLESQADAQGWNKEYLAAKLMGRWRNGVPLAMTNDDARWSAPDATMPEFDDIILANGEPLTAATLNDFDYPDEREGDDALEGRPCPLGAHIRRANPRGARIVQRSANHTRQIVRRGMPYGPVFDPDNAAHRGDGERRGLLGQFFCGSLIGQYEAMMYDWINMGLQDPRITGTNCPIIGANNPHRSRFDIPHALPDPAHPENPEKRTIRGFPRFVETVGAAYLFIPGIHGLQVLADLRDGESR